MSINTRLKGICKNKKIKNIDLVNLGCGSQQTVSFVLNGKVKPNTEFIEIFLHTYGDVNARWLLTGEGEETESIVEDPRVHYGYCKECIKKEGVIEHLKKECAAMQSRIEQLLIKGSHSPGETESQTNTEKKVS